MSYHKFTKLSGLIQEYSVSNFRKGLALKDFDGRECNCNYTMKINGMHAYRYTCQNIVLFKN